MTASTGTKQDQATPAEPSSSDQSASRALNPPRWLNAFTVHLTTLVVGGAWLVWIGRKHWFIADEWAFITGRGLLPGGDLFAPHVQHWVSGPIVIYRLLLNVFGLHTYLPYLLTGVIVHLVVVHLAWRVAVRAGADAWCATCLAVLLLVAASSGPQALHPFQITLNGSVAFGLGLLLLADRRRNPDIRWGALTATLAVISLSFSTVSVPLVMVAAVLLWARQGVRVAIAVFAPSGVVFAAWYQFIGREVLSQGAGSAQITPDTLRNLPEFAWRGLSHAIGEPLQLDGFFGGIILVLVLVVTLTVFLRSVRGPALIAIAAAGGAVAFFSLTAVARANLGPTASRYLYVGGAMLFPLAAVALSRLWSRGTVAVIVVVIVLFSLIVLNARDLRRVALAEAVIVQNLRRELLAVAQVVRDQPDVPGRVVPQLQVNPDLTVARLRSLMRSGWFPSERVDPAAFPEVQWYPHITLSNRPELPLGSDAPTVGSGAQSSEVVDGCSVVAQAPEGRITLSAVAPSSVRVTAPVATAMQIRDAGPSGEDRGMVATRELHPERPVYVNLQRRGAIAIAPYYGTFTVCGLAPAVPGP